jgi:hypothetical protein
VLIKIFGAPYFGMLYGPPMSYGTDHCSKICICSSKEVKRNRDAIVEAHGRKSDLAELHPTRLARPEGFEPPTLRSEVLSNSQQHVLTWKRSNVFQWFFSFHFISVRLSTPHCGNARGNTPGRQINHRTSGRRLQMVFSICNIGRLNQIASKLRYPQILTLCASKIIMVFSSLPCPVSTMFPC